MTGRRFGFGNTFEKIETLSVTHQRIDMKHEFAGADKHSSKNSCQTCQNQNLPILHFFQSLLSTATSRLLESRYQLNVTASIGPS